MEEIVQGPDATWVSGSTYCSTWSGTAYVAFVVDVFCRTIATSLVLDALNMAAWDRARRLVGWKTAPGTDLAGLMCQSDAGSPMHLDHLHHPSRRDRRQPLQRHRRRQLRQGLRFTSHLFALVGWELAGRACFRAS